MKLTLLLPHQNCSKVRHWSTKIFLLWDHATAPGFYPVAWAQVSFALRFHNPAWGFGPGSRHSAQPGEQGRLPLTGSHWSHILITPLFFPQIWKSLFQLVRKACSYCSQTLLWPPFYNSKELAFGTQSSKSCHFPPIFCCHTSLWDQWILMV